MLHLHDVVERPLAQHGVRPDPERGVVLGHALVQDVLDVGGAAGEALETGRRAGVGAVRGLRHRDPLVLGLLEQVDETQAVLGQEHAVGVEGQDVLGVGHVEIRCGRTATAASSVPFGVSTIEYEPPINPM